MISSNATRSVVLAAGITLILLCVIAFYIYWRKKERIVRGNLSQYSLEVIKSATGNLCASNKLGHNNVFGAVYKGRLRDGQEVVVKRLSKDSRDNRIEFKNEILLLGRLEHINVIKLLGTCSAAKENFLIYEFASNLTLNKFLFDPERPLDWETRFKIIIGIARGLLYLHQDSPVKIVHRDLKATNIFLDDDMNPKIGDFRCADILKRGRVYSQAKPTEFCGTFEYMAPEYEIARVYSIKSDVYTFGVMVLEIVSGQSHVLYRRCQGRKGLISHALELLNTVGVIKLVDPFLNNNFPRGEVLRCIQVALLCVQDNPSSRPTMSEVLHLILNDNSSDSQ